MDNNQQVLTAEQVTAYLLENNDFFLTHPDVIEGLQLSESPEGTISFAQRQMDRLQTKNQQLQRQLSDLIDNARQNTALQDRINQLCLRVLKVTSFDELLTLLMTEFKQEFNADEIALRLFYSHSEAPILHESTANISLHHEGDLQAFESILSKQKIVCGRLSQSQRKLFFADKEKEIESVACIPLGLTPCRGILAIASVDEDRFHADMGTEYLQFLSHIIERALQPYVCE